LKIEIIKSQSYKITEAYQGSKSQARRRQSHCPTRLGILISAPGRTPPPAGGFRTQSCRSQSYPLANLQLKPLRTSTSRFKLDPVTVTICKPNRYNIVQNVVQFVQYCNLVPIRTICTICTTTFTNIVQKVSQNVVQFIRKGFELIVQHVVQYRKEY